MHGKYVPRNRATLQGLNVIYVCRIPAGIDSMISLTCSLAGMTVTVTKERYVEMLQKIFPEDSPDNSSESVFMQDGAHLRWLWSDWRIAFVRNWSRWSQSSFGPHFYQIWTPYIFIFLKIKSEVKIPATTSQMKEQVKEIIESIPAEILQRVIGEFTRCIRNCIVARGRLFEK